MSTDRRIRLNVGGIVYETTADTLSQSSYFRTLIDGSWSNTINNIMNETTPYFIDRCGGIFKHVLRLLRNPSYSYPAKYVDELLYYGVPEPESIDNSAADTLDEIRDCRQLLFRESKYCTHKGCDNYVIPDSKLCDEHSDFSDQLGPVPIGDHLMLKSRDGSTLKLVIVKDIDRTRNSVLVIPAFKGEWKPNKSYNIVLSNVLVKKTRK